MQTLPSRRGHLPVNGLNLHHEVYGELGAPKAPLLLIPSAFMSTESMTTWAQIFARRRTVVVFDQQGHGRTPDTSREMSYEQFAGDAAALLRALEVRADVVCGVVEASRSNAREQAGTLLRRGGVAIRAAMSLSHRRSQNGVPPE